VGYGARFVVGHGARFPAAEVIAGVQESRFTRQTDRWIASSRKSPAFANGRLIRYCFSSTECDYKYTRLLLKISIFSRMFKCDIIYIYVAKLKLHILATQVLHETDGSVD